jgi:hypothetical protein
MIPLMLLNFFGGIGSGIWLGILGEWWAIGYGLAAFLGAHFALSLVLMPGLLFSAPAMALLSKGKVFLAVPFILLGQFYTYAVICIWCMGVLIFFVSKATNISFWPLLIWSYGVALGPWMYLAQKDAQAGTGEGSGMTTFFAQIAYIVVALAAAFSGMSVGSLVLVFTGIMLVGLVLQTGFALLMMR